MSTAFDEVSGFDSSATPFNGATIVLGTLSTRSSSRARGVKSRAVSLSGTTGNFDDPTNFDGGILFDAVGPSQSLAIRAQSRTRATVVPTAFYWPTTIETTFDAAVVFDAAAVRFGTERATAATRGQSRVTIKPAPDFDATGFGFDATIGFDGIDVRAFLVTAAPTIRVRNQSRTSGAVRSSGDRLGVRPFAVRTGQQKGQPQRRRPGPFSSESKFVRDY